VAVPLSGQQQSGKDAENACFSGAVGANQTKQFAFFNRKRYIVHRVRFAFGVGFCDILKNYVDHVSLKFKVPCSKFPVPGFGFRVTSLGIKSSFLPNLNQSQ
jgi:hypothetical protein